MKKIAIRIIGQVLSISIFMGVFLFSLFITYGYRYDFEENEVIQTSVIDVCAIPKKADLYLDGEFHSDRACDKIFGLDLGAHTLSIQKEGYFDWFKNIYLDNQNVSIYPQVFLVPLPEFYTTTILDEKVDEAWMNPNHSKYVVYDKSFDVIRVYSAIGGSPLIWETPFDIEELTWMDNTRIVVDTNKGRYQMNIKKGEWGEVENVVIKLRTYKEDVIIKGNELWEEKNGKEVLVTRYSENIQSAQFFYNNLNLLVVTEDDIRICDSDADNCHIVTTKDSWTEVAHPPRSQKIIFVQEGALKQMILSGPEVNSLDLEINL